MEEPKTALPSKLATQCELDGKAEMNGRKPKSLKHCRIVPTNCRWATVRFGVEQRFSRPVLRRAAGNRFRRRNDIITTPPQPQQTDAAARASGSGVDGRRQPPPWNYNYNSMAAAATLSIGLTFLVL